MKKIVVIRSLVLGLLISGSTLAQSTESTQKMSVNDRLIKARAAKAEKRASKAIDITTAPGTAAPQADRKVAQDDMKRAKANFKSGKATPADNKTPIDKFRHGPNGEEIHTGARGAKYYINKNGNRTYLSSNL